MLPIYAVILAVLCVSLGFGGGYLVGRMSPHRRKPSTGWKRPRNPSPTDPMNTYSVLSPFRDPIDQSGKFVSKSARGSNTFTATPRSSWNGTGETTQSPPCPDQPLPDAPPDYPYYTCGADHPYGICPVCKQGHGFRVL